MKGYKNLWNPVLETMPMEDIRKLQLKKFQRVFDYVYHNSPFYSNKFKKAGLKPEDIKTLDDIRRIPLTSKTEMRAAQENKEYLIGVQYEVSRLDICDGLRYAAVAFVRAKVDEQFRPTHVLSGKRPE